MSNWAGQIGFSQRVRLEWLEQTSNLVLAGNDVPAIKESLRALLKEKVSVGGEAVRSNREKIITILLRTWVYTTPGAHDFHLLGLELLKRIPRSDHLPIHWGMVMSVYPFWTSVANHVGRLLRLQETVVPLNVQRRIREQFGERETVFRAARRVLRSFLDWGVLVESRKGVYYPGPGLLVNEPQLVAWMIEAFLRSRSNGIMSLKELLNHPGFFPFRFSVISIEGSLMKNPRIEVSRQSLDEIFVGLKVSVLV